MKKSIAILILLAMTVMLFACVSKPTVPSETDEHKASDTVSTDIVDTEEPKASDTESVDTTVDTAHTDAPDIPEAPVQSYSLPVPDGTQFFFSSGAGAWYSSITLNSDGSFEGEYSDSEMGEMGEGYPNGSVYTSTFKGKFTNIKKTDDYSYSMTLEYIETEKPVGEEWIEDGIRFAAAEAHGITGEDFILYLPETPAVETDKDFLSWWQHRYEHLDENGELTDPTVTLGCYAIRNMTDNFGFFEY